MSTAKSKSQLIQELSAMDTAVLQKLVKYADLLIIPDENLLVNATMIQMVDEAETLANSLFPEWTDRSKSDFGRFLIEIMAIFSEKDFWYLNAFANEGILRKMRSYSNAYSRASSMGYRPTTCTSASAPFDVTFASGDTTEYIAGDLIVTVEGKQFTNDDSFILNQSAAQTTQSLTLFEGSRFIEDVSYNGYNVYIRKKNIDINSIRVVVNNVYYQRVNNFGLSDKDSSHYLVLPEEDGSISIYFGSNGFGSSPTIGTYVRVEYRASSGASGDTKESDAQITDSLSEREVMRVAMMGDATGGRDAESLTSIKETAPLYFNTKRAVINEKIGIDTLNTFPFIHKSNVTSFGSFVSYQAIPVSGGVFADKGMQLSAEQRKVLEDEFEPFGVMGFSINYEKNNYIEFIETVAPGFTDITVEVNLSVSTDRTRAIAAIKQVFYDITSPLISAEYGKTFDMADAEFRIRSNVRGVNWVKFYKGDDVIEANVGLETPKLGSTEIFAPIDIDRVHVIPA